MLRFRYNYRTHITFSENIFSHHFLLRCIPCESEAQTVIENTCTILPENKKTFSFDSFGNLVVTGYMGDFHNFFEFQSEGIVELQEYCLHEPLNHIYLYPSVLTQPASNILEICDKLIFSEQQSVHERIFMISNELNKAITYVSGVTSVQTTAEDSLKIGQGVCQDFAHIMISICRKKGIAARYVTGFMQGEGFTHAWIEYYANDAWYGFDPTHNRPAEPGYIKLSHGRDYTDCAIDKGVFRGLTQQNLEVSLKVEQIL